MAEPYLETDAVISDCERYRYLLRRIWDSNRPRALFVMLNPSTADASEDDATIRSCRRLATSWGYGGFEVANLYGFRATDPNDLARAGEPVGDRNDGILEAAVCRCDMPIAAWGANKMASRGRVDQIKQIIRRHRPAVMCLGKTKAGAPKHPLYIKTGTALVVY